MCGIFGLRILPDVETNFSQIKRIVELLHLLSESRGKEAAGIAIGIKDELLY
jgi:glutamine phosphoribosylpyrophosphate amidotransferase